LGQICGRGELRTVAPAASVTDAATVMRDHRVGAVLVTESRTLAGVISERDIAYRVVAAGLDPRETRVDTVMTRDVMSAEAGVQAVRGLQLMAENQIRHLPVLEGTTVVGIVSVRDFVASEMAQVQDEIVFEGAVAEELW
jgi:CBS domain-containing protein